MEGSIGNEARVARHLVFADDTDDADDAGQAAHLPDHARGIMGPISPEMRRDLHRLIAAVLQSK